MIRVTIRAALNSVVPIMFFSLVSLASTQTLEVTMTAYNSEPNQTSGDPFTTASGEEVRPGIVAVSPDLLEGELPFGTELRVVEINDDPNRCGAWDPEMTLEVQDRTHSRFSNRVDIWLETVSEARVWGNCQVVLEVVG